MWWFLSGVLIGHQIYRIAPPALPARNQQECELMGEQYKWKLNENKCIELERMTRWSVSDPKYQEPKR